MDQCTDPENGHKILAYELGHLSDDEMECFEQHLFECEYCTNEVWADRQFVNILKTAIRENTATEEVIQFARLKTFSAEHIRTFQEKFQAILDSWSHMPGQTIVYADTEEPDKQDQLEIQVKDSQGNTIGHASVRVLETPCVKNGCFTVELEVLATEYYGAKISIGMKLWDKMIIASEYERIPSDGLILIREEIPFDQKSDVPLDVLNMFIMTQE